MSNSNSNSSNNSTGCPVKNDMIDNSNNNNNNNVKASECPIKISNSSNSNNSFNWFGFGSNKPNKTTIISPPPSSSSSSTSTSDKYNEAAGDLIFGQERQIDQKAILGTTRNVSSIPKSDFTPGHQPAGIDQWVYPSEQQYYNAMKRKGYEVKESEVSAVLAIHNLVNEEGWSRVKEWESIRGDHVPKLKQFIGRPTDVSPKADLRNFFLGQRLPFDRHDWVIDRNGKEVRYVIDFYKGASKPNAAISIFLDVRPALDSPEAVVDVLSNFYRKDVIPYFKSHYNKYIK